ncbi:MAG: tryptophan-rich sensory protein [Hydrogenophaga sp.]|uniref:TspO/MBR family protein n=1 Tax=Hydrogenophaga sp. TaxID=1904254 RepID=UPI001D68533F|nr:TspO/MBR family protein [Hydrogenophaga sp.]MBW0171711.1 tryptophan-rich sensory protein [Hydrogenophaga sp.]MBW0184011.1 tryptophan-rich sensory protein [Hydrogenophaga sp.]
MTTRSTRSQMLGFLGWLALVMATGGLGALASIDAASFYAELKQPAWAPPAGVFGPVWTVLYLLMGVAAWLVWREVHAPARRSALVCFVVQLAVNALWSWLFFAWHLGAWALADVLLLLALIVVTIALFARVRRLAAWLLVPYLAWVAFASVLNATLWLTNPGVL